MRRISLALVLLVPLFAFAKVRAVRSPSAPEPVAGPTFSKEVVRIFQQHCQTCHHEGDIAPFSLTTFQEAKPYANLIKLMTQSRQMPPWKPADGCGDFKDERKLTQGEIDTIAKWVDSGAPEGNRADLPAPLDFSGGWALGQPDQVFKMSEPFTPPAGKDTYRCFTIPTNLTSPQHVQAVDTRPGDRETVHHVITFIDTTGASVALDEADPGPGYTCFGGPGFSLPSTLGGWAPGSRPLELPAGTAFNLPAGSRVVIQVHYHPHGHHTHPDQTEIGVYFAKEPPKSTMLILPIVNQTFTIPPNNSNYEVLATWPFPMPPAKLHFVAPHMHLLGKTMKVLATRPNGTSECLIQIDDWDFNWQGAYMYKQPISIPLGTILSLRATFDNSSSNPRNPNNPPKPVSWGEETTDEMCIAFVGLTLDN
jgi:Copper type II ascorbate-dependent monooxygenase, C-terminal domain